MTTNKLLWTDSPHRNLNLDQLLKSDFNTLTLDKNTGKVEGEDTFRGRVYSRLHGCPLLKGKKKIFVQKLDEWAHDIEEEALSSIRDTKSSKQVKKVISGAKKDLEKLEKLGQKIHLPKESQMHLHEEVEDLSNILDRRGEIFSKVSKQKSMGHYQKKIARREAKIKKFTPERGTLAEDIEHSLSISTVEDFTAPLKPREEAYIDRYLKHSPVHSKQLAHYEMIQRATDQLTSNMPAGAEKKKFTFGEEKFEVYDVTNAEYTWIGTAGYPVDFVDDYKGYCEGKWPYLCTSLVTQELKFFMEPNTVFQVFSLPPEAISHTSESDLQSPAASTAKLQKKWYGIQQKAKVLDDHIETAYNQHMLIQSEAKSGEKGAGIPMHTEWDQLIEIDFRLEQIRNRLQSEQEHCSEKQRAQIVELVSLLKAGGISKQNLEKLRKIIHGDFVKKLQESEIFEEKDLNELNELVDRKADIIEERIAFVEQRSKEMLAVLERGKESAPEEVQKDFEALINVLKMSEIPKEEDKKFLRSEYLRESVSNVRGAEVLDEKEINALEGIIYERADCISWLPSTLLQMLGDLKDAKKSATEDDIALIEYFEKVLKREQTVDRKEFEEKIQLGLSKGFLPEYSVDSYFSIVGFYQDPYSLASETFSKDYLLNRVFYQILSLKDYYKNATLSPEEKKERFCRLFGVNEDPSGQYDIVGELEKTEKYLHNIPMKVFDENGEWAETHLNRFMGPQEILSQYDQRMWNEINIDTQKGGGVQVKAIIIPKDLFEMTEYEQDVLKVLRTAEIHQVPVFIR